MLSAGMAGSTVSTAATIPTPGLQDSELVQQVERIAHDVALCRQVGLHVLVVAGQVELERVVVAVVGAKIGVPVDDK